jgi:acyl-CoA thioesterase-1
MFLSLNRVFTLSFLFFLIIGVNFISTNAYCNLKVALFGDSLMSGYGLDEEFHLSVVLEKNLKQKGFDVTIVNASVSGDTTSGGLNRLNWLLKNREIDIIILCLGANDMLRGTNPDLIKRNLNRILVLLRERNIKILLAGMLAQKTYGKKYKNSFDEIYPQLAKKHKVAFLPFLLEGVALDPKYNLDDGKHPNPSGVKLISKNLEEKLINLLEN